MTSEQLALKIRQHALEMVYISKSSHIGAALSVADIIAVLYNDVLKVSAEDSYSKKRDKLILSKGHACAALYAALAEKGFFSVEELKTHCANGSRLSGHVSHKGVPGIEVSTGSLGHGVCVAAGMAIAAKKDMNDYRIYAVIGDGECDEGSVWEMALFANHYQLNNLTIIIDHNKQQALGFCNEQMSLSNLSKKWKAFGWSTIEVDGHNHKELLQALSKKSKHKPICIIANTIKGKGVSFMENKLSWHYRAPNIEEYREAMIQLGGER